MPQTALFGGLDHLRARVPAPRPRAPTPTSRSPVALAEVLSVTGDEDDRPAAPTSEASCGSFTVSNSININATSAHPTHCNRRSTNDGLESDASYDDGFLTVEESDDSYKSITVGSNDNCVDFRSGSLIYGHAGGRTDDYDDEILVEREASTSPSGTSPP